MISTAGIVLKSLRYRESSLILDVFTESHGLLSFIINGVFKKNDQKLASVLSVGNLIQLVAYYHESRTLHRIKEVQFDYVFQNLHEHPVKSAIAVFILEVCRKTLKEHQVNPEIFQFIQRVFILLDSQDQIDYNYHLYFLIRFSKFLGFNPIFNYSNTNICFDLVNGNFTSEDEFNPNLAEHETSRILYSFGTSTDRNKEQTKNLNSRERKLLLELLIRYYSVHIENFGKLNTPDIYRSIFY